MVQPINYMAQIPALDLTQSSMNLGSALQEFTSARRSRADAEALKRAYNNDLTATFEDPTAKNWAKLSAKYPQQREAFKQAWDLLDDDRKDNEFFAGAEVYNSLVNKNPETALNILDERIKAAKNSDEPTEDLESIRDAIEADPNQASKYLAFTLSTLDPDRWSKISEEGRLADKAPSELTTAQAKARKAAIDADFAESQAIADLEKKGWDIYKIQEDTKVAKENSKIAALNSDLRRQQLAIDKAKNDTQREQLELRRREMEMKLDEMKRKRDEAINSKVAEVETARLGIDNSLNTIDRLLQNPELPNVVGSLEGARFYPSTMMAILNPMADADRRADATADIETVQGQQFLDNLMTAKERGATFGSLTEREGAKLEGYIASLKTRQSEPQFINNLKEIQRLLLKSRKILADKTGVPDTPADTPNVEVTPEDIDALLLQYGGE